MKTSLNEKKLLELLELAQDFEQKMQELNDMGENFNQKYRKLIEESRQAKKQKQTIT